MDVKWDMKALDTYAMDLHQAPTKLQPELTAIVKRLMQEAKQQQMLDFAGSSNSGFRAIAGHVRYTEPSYSAGAIRSKLGVDKGGAGSLGNIAVFGTYKGGGTHLHPTYYVTQAMPGSVAAIQKVLKGVLTS